MAMVGITITKSVKNCNRKRRPRNVGRRWLLVHQLAVSVLKAVMALFKMFSSLFSSPL